MSGAQDSDRELDDLVQEVLDGATDDATREALFARIEVDPAARERVRRMRGVFEQLGRLRHLPLPARAAATDVRMPSITAPPAFRPRRTRRASGVRARWALIAVATAAGAAFLLIGPSREFLLDSWRGAAGTIGLQDVPFVAHWHAHDVEVRLGAGPDPLGVRVRLHMEATIPGTVAIAFDPSLWRVRGVEISGSGAGSTSPEPGSLQVSVVRDVEVALTLEPIAGGTAPHVITLHLRAGDDVTTQVVPIESRGQRSANFPGAGR